MSQLPALSLLAWLAAALSVPLAPLAQSAQTPAMQIDHILIGASDLE